MRRNILIIISFLTLLVSSGCTNLDEKWYSEVTPDTYFTSKETVYSFLVRSFTHWRWFHGFDRAILQECTTDEMCVTQKGIHYNDVRYSQLQHHDWTPLHPNNEETWRGVGMGVAMALACKEDLSGVDYVSLGMTEELKADHQMQLQTLVAYFYLRGLDFYGGMPIYRRSTTEEVPRSTARETFNYVEELLLAAIPKLEKKRADMLEEGYLRQGTAAALLAQLYFNAEVYMGENRFAECAQVCQDLLDGKYGYYELEEDWFGPFTFDNNKSKEVMWSVQSQYAKGTLFQWQFERYNHYNAKNYFDLSGYSSTNGMHLQPSLKPNGDPYTDKLGRPFAKFNNKDLRKKLYLYKGNGKYEGMFLYGKLQRTSRSGTEVKCTGLYEYPGEVLEFVDQVAQFKKVKDGEYSSVNELPSNISTGEDMLEEGYLRQGTAAALLAQLYFNAEVYMGENRFAECAQVCQDLLDGKYGYYELEEDWFGPFTFDNNKSKEVMWSVQSQYAKGTLFQWQFERYNHYNAKNYFDLSGYSSTNGMHLQPSLKPNGDPYTDKLGRPFAKFNNKDLRKKLYLYKGNGKYEGMFLYGKLQRTSRSGTEVKCTGLYEYPGEVLEFVDQVAQFKKVKDGEYSSVNELPSNISTGEENSGIRLCKLPVPDNIDKTIAFNPDYPVIRFAEIYYMLAECKYRSGYKKEAANLFNEVRKRNFENKADPDPVTETNIDKYRILDEWMVEFLGEQRRRTDLRRWGLYTTGSWWDHKPTNDDHYELFPIPEKSISVSNVLKQNPGYGGGNEMTKEEAGIYSVKQID